MRKRFRWKPLFCVVFCHCQGVGRFEGMQNGVLRDMLCEAKRDMPDGRDMCLTTRDMLANASVVGGLGK